MAPLPSGLTYTEEIPIKVCVSVVCCSQLLYVISICLHSDSAEAVVILCRVKPPQFSPNEGTYITRSSNEVILVLNVFPGFMSMPLLLGQGPLKLVDSVFRWMVAKFDCFITPFSLTQENLLLLAGHYANAGWYSCYSVGGTPGCA